MTIGRSQSLSLWDGEVVALLKCFKREQKLSRSHSIELQYSFLRSGQRCSNNDCLYRINLRMTVQW